MRKVKPGKRLMLFAVGLISSLAFPPLHLFPLVIFGLWYAATQAHKADNWKKAFGVGAWFGAGLSMGGRSWTLIPISSFEYQLIIAVIFACTLCIIQLAIMTGVATLAYWKKPYAVTFAAAWVAIELVQTYLPSLLIWNMLGTVWGFSDIMIQPASVVGTYGLSFATVFIATLLVKPSRAKVSLATGLAVIWIGFGAIRLADAVNVPVKDMRLRIVQPNFSVEQKHSFLVEEYIKLNTLVNLSRKAGWEDITHIIWPENSIAPGVFTGEGAAVSKMLNAVPPNGYLIIGAHSEYEYDKTHNSIIVMNDTGKVAQYDKSYLIPVVEYIPLRWLFGNIIKRFFPIEQDLIHGTGIKTIELERTPPFSPLICFEVIFPDNVVDKNNKPAWIINVANDGWYIKTFGSYQHFMEARMRAVEEGVPLVRSAKTGISAVIDPYGRVVDKLPLLVKGIIDADLPAAVPSTIYNKFGNIATLVFIMAAAFASLAVSFIAGKYNKSKTKNSKEI